MNNAAKKTILKKSVTERFSQIWNGRLTFDIRLNHLDLEKYEVGDVLRLREFVQRVEHMKFSTSGDPGFYDETRWDYTGREVTCIIKSMSIVRIPEINCDDGCIYPSMEIDGKAYWSAEDLHKYGIVIIGIEVMERILRKL